MTFNLILNNNNVVPGSYNSSYKYTFIKPLNILDDAEMAVSNITVPYSFFNVTSANDNNSFRFHFPDSASTGTVYDVVLQDGFYSVTDINAALQQFCIANGLYLINASGKYVYYLTMLYNPTFYAIQVIAQLVPTSLPSGWTQPSNWPGYNTISYTPFMVIVQENFGKIIGFPPGYVCDNQTVNQSELSPLTPQGSIINSLIVRCSLVDNEGFPSDVLDTIPITSTFGTNINYQPTQLKFLKLSSGVFQSFIITFVDQNLNIVYVLHGTFLVQVCEHYPRYWYTQIDIHLAMVDLLIRSVCLVDESFAEH
jgi:hypothetical protein